MFSRRTLGCVLQSRVTCTRITLPLWQKILRNSSSSSFEVAQSRLASLREEPDNDTKLKLYGLFKQATVGDCTALKPGMLDFVAKAKWEAWNQLKNTTKSDAESGYVQLVDTLLSHEDKESETLNLLTSSESGVFTITMNRPSKKNALTTEMYRGIISGLDEAAADESVRIAVLTGEGDFYSSGNDLKNVAMLAKPGGLEMAYKGAELLREFVDRFISFPKPLVAVVNGPAVGLAVTTLGLCDLVYASDKATFHTPFSSLGITAEGCSSLLFPRIMGPARANELLIYGRKLSATDAYDWGLVSDVIPYMHFKDEVSSRLRHLAGLPPQAVQLTKKLSHECTSDLLHHANKREVEILRGRFTSEEALQAATRFFLKNKT